jgi:hypothetical protein
MESRKHVLAVRDFFNRSPLLMCALYSCIAMVAAWGNSRYRVDAAPFHLVTDHTWRGYPFPYEEWEILVTNDATTVWSKFHWTGAVVDALLIGVVWLAARYLIGTSSTALSRTFILSIYSATLVWLNIEAWLYGAPALFFCSSCTVGRITDLTLGFPFVSWTAGEEPRMWAQVANIAIGITGWLLLYRLLRWARRGSRVVMALMIMMLPPACPSRSSSQSVPLGRDSLPTSFVEVSRSTTLKKQPLGGYTLRMIQKRKQPVCETAVHRPLGQFCSAWRYTPANE